ncbi:MAG TPA: hypothetical protein VJV78_11980 [Polyangiales bacterium]|nr:hypothetical protein [Polyangiales bacterium]
MSSPLGAKVIELEGWQLELPEIDPSSPVHSLVPGLAPGAVASPALDCTSHEIGRILLQAPDKMPSLAAMKFISARCHAVVAAPMLRSWSVTVDRSVSDATLIEQLKANLKAEAKINAAEVGIAMVRDQKRAIFVISHATPQMKVAAANVFVGTEPAFRIHGRVSFDASAVEAYVNVGESSVAMCELDPSQTLPEFSASCPVASTDQSAWVQVLAVPRGRLISNEVFQAIVLRRPDAATVYRPRGAGEARPATDSATFAAGVLDKLNERRGQMGLRPLELGREQSDAASTLTPGLFLALGRAGSGKDSSGDLLALGLMAGWDISGGMIRDSRFVLNLSIDTLDADRWLRDLLDLPMGRAVLLDPNANALAIGAAVQAQPPAVAAIALTYSFFEPEQTPGTQAKQLLQRLARLREARNLGTTTMVAELPDLQPLLSGIHRGAIAPDDALQSMMQTVVDKGHQKVQGFVWDTQSLDAIEFPDELLRKGDITLAAGVTYYKAPDAAWGQYCVLFVVVDTPHQEEA